MVLTGTGDGNHRFSFTILLSSKQWDATHDPRPPKPDLHQGRRDEDCPLCPHLDLDGVLWSIASVTEAHPQTGERDGPLTSEVSDLEWSLAWTWPEIPGNCEWSGYLGVMAAGARIGSKGTLLGGGG